jgi:hypothetical protein
VRRSGFFTTDFTDLKDFTDGEKLPARKIFQRKQEAAGFTRIRQTIPIMAAGRRNISRRADS